MHLRLAERSLLPVAHLLALAEGLLENRLNALGKTDLIPLFFD